MKFLRTLLGLVVNDWWLKLIALLIAIVLFLGEKSERSDTSVRTTNDRSILQFR